MKKKMYLALGTVLLISMTSAPVMAGSRLRQVIEGKDEVQTTAEPEEPAAQTPEEAPAQVPEETPEEVPEEVPAETPEEVPEEVPAETPEEVPEEGPAETPEEVPEEAPETGAVMPEQKAASELSEADDLVIGAWQAVGFQKDEGEITGLYDDWFFLRGVAHANGNFAPYSFSEDDMITISTEDGDITGKVERYDYELLPSDDVKEGKNSFLAADPSDGMKIIIELVDNSDPLAPRNATNTLYFRRPTYSFKYQDFLTAYFSGHTWNLSSGIGLSFIGEEGTEGGVETSTGLKGQWRVNCEETADGLLLGKLRINWESGESDYVINLVDLKSTSFTMTQAANSDVVLTAELAE